MYEDFVFLLKSGKYKKASTLLDNYLSESPNDVYLLTQKANVLWNMDQLEKALDYAQRAELIAPCDGLLVFTAGRILWSMGSYEESVVRWDRLLSADVNQMSKTGYGNSWAQSLQNDARYYKADCLYHLYQDEEAKLLMTEHISNRRKGLQSDFTIDEARRFLRLLSYSSNINKPQTIDSQSGIPTLSQADRIEKHVQALANKKQQKALISYLKRKCREFPSDYWLKTTLSEILCSHGDKACLKYAEEAYRIAPEDMLAVYNYARSLYINGRNDKAVCTLKVIQEKSLDFLAYSEHGEGMRWAKKLKRDTDALMKLIGRDTK